MPTLCDCTSKYENSGMPSCTGTLIAAARKLIIVPKYKADGTLNKLSLPATLNQAFFDALKNNVDRNLRWYPLPKFVNAEMPKAESVYETFGDGSKSFVRKGLRTFKAVFPSMQPQYLSVLESGKCNDMACYIVDKNSALVGLSNGEENVLYPMSINKNTMDAILMWATDTTGQNISFQMEFDTDMDDNNIVKIDASDMVGVNLLNLEGLYDARKSYTSTGTAAMVVKLYTDYGSAATPVKIEGLVATDFALYNVTTSAAVAILTSTETVKGTYTLTYGLQTAGNVLRLTPTKTGIDFTTSILTTSIVV